MAEVDVDRETGKIYARKFTVAHDCGLIINPDGLVKTIEGNIVQGLSRTLWEEVQFDNATVTSVDWETYPILDITETPAEIDVVLINRPDIEPTGAGEPAMRPARSGGGQCGVRCDRRSHSAHPVLARAGEGGALVVEQE